jgi:segregation and condensation protein A
MSDAYNVHLEVFEGPLDLLLYLIEKNDMDVYDIPISQITAEYVEYLDLMKQLNLNLASEFLVMAANLMQIKAQTLLPSKKTGVEGEEGPDPRDELVARLLEYQKYKQVSQFLQTKEIGEQGTYYKSATLFNDDDFMIEASIFDLMNSFREIVTRLPTEVKEIIYEEIPVEQKIREILDYVDNQISATGKKYVNFEELFLRETTRIGLIILFMALLELIRLKQILARQSILFGKIRIYRIDERQ